MIYDDHLLPQLVNSTVEDVSIKEGVSYDCVLRVLERRISANLEWGQYEALGVPGLDEIAQTGTGTAEKGAPSVLKRRCYGLFNLKHLFQRIFLDLEVVASSQADHPMWPNHGISQ